MTDIVYDQDFSTRAFTDTDADGELTSSVIDHVYYSTKDKLLFVQLVSGVLAGYENVPQEAYQSLYLINRQRVGGNKSASVGQYWNYYVRPCYGGYETADVNLLTAEEAEEKAQQTLTKQQQELVDAIRAMPTSGKVLADSIVAKPVQPQLRQFGVTFEGNEEQDMTLAVKATDVDDALRRFNEAADILGWEKVKIVAVITFF